MRSITLSTIAGPSEQLQPTESAPNSVNRAAAVSADAPSRQLPSSSTVIMTTMRSPEATCCAAQMASPASASEVIVSIIRRSTPTPGPPSASAAICSAKATRASARPTLPSGSRRTPSGPIAPATHVSAACFSASWLFTSLRYPLQVVVAFCTISVAKDHRLVGDGIDRNCLLNHSVEELSSVFGASPVEAEGEFVKIELQVLLADRALVRTQNPSLQQRRDQVNPGQQFRSGFLLAFHHRDLMDVALLFDRRVALPPVGMHRASLFNRLLNESHQSAWSAVHCVAMSSHSASWIVDDLSSCAKSH